MTDLEYRIGGLDPLHPTEPSKWIVHREDERTVGIYALIENDELIHADIVRHFSLQEKNVLGGGSYEVEREGDLFLYNWSKRFGPVPEDVAQKVGEAIAIHLKKTGVEIKRVLKRI